jgi:ribosome-associated translation inhibitor RaiA
MRKDRLRQAATVEVVTQGAFLGIEEYAERKIGSLLRLAHEPVLAAQVRLTRSPDPFAARRVVARASVDVNGRPVHVGATAATARESVDLLAAKLRIVLERHARHWEARRARHSHRTEVARRRDARGVPAPRSAEEPEIVARGSFTGRSTVADAADELDRLGDDFYLFTEGGSGQDAVLHRAGPAGYRLATVEPSPAVRPGAPGRTIDVSTRRPPLLTALEAVDRLEALGLPFVFYLDADRGRGCVVHRRRDGRYGLVVPTAAC